METRVDSESTEPVSTLELRLLGPLAIRRDGATLTLPASRKVRGLLGYLALAPRPVSRSQLCELLWDVPQDPRGELRWCLSKIRGLVDTPGRPRVDARAGAVRLDLAGCRVDAIEIGRAAEAGIATVPAARLHALCALFAGEFLEGLEIDRNPAFNTWLTAQRHRLRGCHAALLEHCVARAEGDDVFRHVQAWIALAPFDARAHGALLRALAARGRLREGEEHLAATARLFEAEGLDAASIRDLWRAARAAGPAVGAAPAREEPPARGDEAPVQRRASVAVMPFVDVSAAGGAAGGPADGLAHDVITRLAKLRSLFVIAQGSVFALRDRRIGPQEAGRMLNVDYTVGGTLRRAGPRLIVSVELVETRTARIIWAEMFDHPVDDAFLVMDAIGNRIVASVASEIETAERNRALLKPPNSLDAWEAHHRGLWHMYRFTRADNAQAQRFFESAVRRDPTFARAHAGLSFTHFQNAFQGWAERATEIDRAFAAAGQSLMADDRDPAAHWAMGRALWLRGSHARAIIEMESAVDLSPNFALGHYTLAFFHAQDGDPAAAMDFSDYSRQLSPFDPLLFAMLGSRAIALARLQRFDEAADWGVKAAARPNAHAQIMAIAAYTLALAGRREEARRYLGTIHRTLPHYGVADFLTAMQFSPDAAALFRSAARRISDG
ncbi:MAG: transcriptional regulator [Alphaproteobacteria bacterium]|nr:transcriptional regulator [Alphaproteobacteria bacterium]